MPHIDLKFYPRGLSEEATQKLVDDLSAVLINHLGTTDKAISVMLTEVQPEAWKSDVYDPVIRPAVDQMAKKPGYTL
jgi:4-oxalocrotonate tautomerase